MDTIDTMDTLFKVEIDRFVEDVVGLRGSLALLMFLTSELRKKFVDNPDPPSDSVTFAELSKQYRRKRDIFTANRVLPRSFIVALVSRYDAYLGRLIRAMFQVKPEILNTSEKSLSFSQLVNFDSIDAAKEFVIEKEIETVLRKSHAEQFDWLESKLGIKLRKDLATWPSFIELTERRNLFVHTDGFVSSQYISVCKQHDFRFEREPKLGERLTVNSSYYSHAVDTMLDIGIKLGHVVWMKLVPQEFEEASNSLNSICVDLIDNEFYNVAISVLEFALYGIGRKPTNECRLMYTINLAQAYKWKGDTTKCRETLLKEDWNTLSYRYRLAYLVLVGDFDQACEIMQRIGRNDDELDPDAYESWPLFKEFRETECFKSTYQQIYGKEFIGMSQVAATSENADVES